MGGGLEARTRVPPPRHFPSPFEDSSSLNLQTNSSTFVHCGSRQAPPAHPWVRLPCPSSGGPSL